MASTIGVINPYRYKSYYYDQETQMYYLQSRYYDAGVQRFVSADEIEYLGVSGEIYSYNLYVYCENSPINNSDPTGYVVFSLFGFTLQIGCVVGIYLSLWLVNDTYGNSGVLISTGKMFMAPQISLTYSPFISFRKSVYDLEGESFVLGVGYELGLSAGLDFSFDSKGLSTIQLNIGIGGSALYGVDIHLRVPKMFFVSWSIVTGSRRTNKHLNVNLNVRGYRRKLSYSWR